MVTCLIDYRFPRKGREGLGALNGDETAARPLGTPPAAAGGRPAALLSGALGLLGRALAGLRGGPGRGGQRPDVHPITLNGLTLAGLYFISASGLTLIFGLLRVTNLAHGALFLLGGYMALELVQDAGMSWWWPPRWRCWPAAASAWSCTSSSCAGTRGRTCARP